MLGAQGRKEQFFPLKPFLQRRLLLSEDGQIGRAVLGIHFRDFGGDGHHRDPLVPEQTRDPLGMESSRHQHG